jgi:HPt (histidine-containing phosphotransfer) domain-containing protein
MDLPQEFYVNYITRREKDLAALTEAAQTQNVEVFQRVGHQIKGNAESFGFGELTVIAQEIEKVTPIDMVNKSSEVVLAKFSFWIQEKRKIYFA